VKIEGINLEKSGASRGRESVGAADCQKRGEKEGANRGFPKATDGKKGGEAVLQKR